MSAASGSEGVTRWRAESCGFERRKLTLSLFILSPSIGVWTDHVNSMPLSRWYPTVETLETGDAIIIGGEVSSAIASSSFEASLTLLLSLFRF